MRSAKIEALILAAGELELAGENLSQAKENHDAAQVAALTAFAAHTIAKQAVKNALRKLDAARRALGIFITVEPLSKLNLIPTGERHGDGSMATKNELGFKVGTDSPPPDVVQVKAKVTQGDVVVLEETFSVPGESSEFWVEDGSAFDVSTVTIDNAGNEQVEEAKVFSFTAVDQFPPSPLEGVTLSATGERQVEIPEPTDPPVE